MKESSYYIGFICGAVLRPSYIFLGGEGAASFVFARPRRKAGARHVVPGRSRRARRACPCRPDAGRAIFSRRPRAKRKCLAPRRRSRPAPPRGARGGKGGRWMRPRRGGLLRLRLVLAFDALSPVRSGAVRRPEEGVAAARGGEADRAPRVRGEGGDLKCSCARQCPIRLAL